jgi:16S rRNA processing protein RimM
VNNSAAWVVVGRFGRAHGIKGFVRVHSFTEPRDNILHYTNWHAYIAKQWLPLKILQIEVHNKAILVQVEGYNEREQVGYLNNVDIAVDRSQLPPLKPGEYYWDELIGMQVVNQQGQSLGTVVDMMATGANDVLVVEGEKRHLVPYLPGRFVIDIDTKQRLITVDWDVDF